MAFERVFELSGRGVPDFDGAVGGGAGDVEAVGGKLHARDGFLVTAEDEGGFVVELSRFGGRGGCGGGVKAVGWRMRARV